ncbi:MAG: putative extracellular nuclease [Flavobacteriales bacterium]|jgi:predicted extracellular nuclease
MQKTPFNFSELSSGMNASLLSNRAMRIAGGFSFALLLLSSGCAEKKSVSVDAPLELEMERLSVMFYNVENLFDIEDDPNTFDEDFTPNGKLTWDQGRLDTKILNLGKVVDAAAEGMPDILGLCEIENLAVIEEFAQSAYLKATPYKIIHKESPDGRGIDVALLYNSSRVSLSEVNYIQSKLPSGDRPNTRLVLHAKGDVGGQEMHFFVNHWPSRGGGKEASEPNRMTVAYNVRQEVNAVLEENENAAIILMGDFNDYPNDKSMVDVLSSGRKGEKLLYNLMWEKHKLGEGSYNYRGEWGALDQFVVSQNLADGLEVDVDESTVRFVREEWMMYTNDKGEVYPSRTYGGPNYYGGYSDHLPIYMEVKLK